MPRKTGAASNYNMPNIQSSAESAPSNERQPKPSLRKAIEKSPEDKLALDYLRRAYEVMDKYDEVHANYELELLNQRKTSEPTEKQKKLKSELQDMWEWLKGMDSELAEHEYMTKNEDLKKSLALVREKIADLHSFTGQELPPSEVNKAQLETSMDVKIESRRAAKLRAQENIRSKDQIKKLRVKLAKLKSAFAGAYKMSPARAQILLSQPTGVMGALKGLYEGKLPTNEERKKLKALRSEDAQELLSDIHNLENRINDEWKKAKKEEIESDFADKETIEEIEPDESVSIQTLREVYNEQIKIAKLNGDNKKASEILQELQDLKTDLQHNFPELLREEDRIDASEESARKTILPPEPVSDAESPTIKEANTIKEFVPPTARDFQHEPQVVIPQEKAAKEAPTLRSEKETQKHEKMITGAIDAFGGGETGRKYAADLWDYANKQIQESGKINLQGEKHGFKDALDYVNAFAEKVTQSAETLGRERSASIWQEINDHRNELLKSPSLKASERKKLEKLDPIYYVHQSALRDKALQDNDLDAAGNHNAIIDDINAMLGYPEGMNPSTGEGMGQAPKQETQALGKNSARKELSQATEKATGMGTRSIETSGRSRELTTEPIYSVEWAAKLLPNAKAEWNTVNELIKKEPKEAKKIINSEIKLLINAIKKLSDKDSDVSNEFQGLTKLMQLRKGSPIEATRFVMLKAANKLTPVYESDKEIQHMLGNAITGIERKLKNLDKALPSFEEPAQEKELPRFKLPEEEKELPRFETPDEAPEIEVREATENEAYLAKEAAEEATQAERLDKLTEKEISNVAEKINKKRLKNIPMPRDFHDKVVNELRKFYSALNENRRQMANLSMGRLSKYLRNKLNNKDIIEIQNLLREAKEEFLEAA